MNSGGALVPPHFIDINRGGTGPPCKATSIEWRCTILFWHHFLYRIVGHECTLGNFFFYKIHLYRILGYRFHICDPKPGWNILSWLGARGGRAQHSIEAVLGTFLGEPVLPCLMDFQRFWWTWSALKLIETELNWFELIWYDLMIFADTWSWEFLGYLGFDWMAQHGSAMFNKSELTLTLSHASTFC